MYDELPTAQLESARLKTYFELAAQGKPNTQQCYEAQIYARQNFLGVTSEKGLSSASAQISGEELETAREKYPEFVERVVKSLVGTEFQIAVSPQTMLAQIEKSHPGIWHATRKIGVNIGAIPANSPSGK